MDFNCDQKNDVHFFYTLPFSKNTALIETTWLSDLEDQSLMNYDLQLENYIKNNLGIKNVSSNYSYGNDTVQCFYLLHCFKGKATQLNILAMDGIIIWTSCSSIYLSIQV